MSCLTEMYFWLPCMSHALFNLLFVCFCILIISQRYSFLFHAYSCSSLLPFVSRKAPYKLAYSQVP